MPTSSRVQLPFPTESTNPWFAVFQAMVEALDAQLYAVREDRNVVIAGGGTMSFSATSGILTWSAEITLFAPITGYLWKIPAGSVTLQDGQLFYITVVRGPQSSNTYNPSVASTIPTLVDGDSQLLIGWRKGTVVHFRDGHAIGDQDVKLIFDNPTGTGGTGSPGGNTGELQYKNGGVFSGASNVTYDGTNLILATALKFKNGANFGTLQMTPTGARTLTLPDATDTLLGRATIDTVTNKTMVLSSNTVSDTSAAQGDFVKHNGSRFVRFAKGTVAGYVPRVSDDLTDVVFDYPVALGPNGSGYADIKAAQVRNTSDSKMIAYTLTGSIQTTNGTQTTIKSWTLNDSRYYSIRALVTLTDGSAKYAEYSVKAGYSKFSGTISQRHKAIVTETESDASFDVDIVINGTTSVDLKVTGIAATTVRWTVQELVHETIP